MMTSKDNTIVHIYPLIFYFGFFNGHNPFLVKIITVTPIIQFNDTRSDSKDFIYKENLYA